MTNTPERNDWASSPLAGLAPTRTTAEPSPGRHLAEREQSRLTRGLLSTVPVVLVGSIALATMNLTGGIEVGTRRLPGTKTPSDLAKSVKDALAAANTQAAPEAEAPSAGQVEAASVPSTYRVRGGDTISSIAGRYGLSTASVLAVNGLGWKSIIFPGQVLKLTKHAASSPAPAPAPAPSTSHTYKIRSGDTLSGIASHFRVPLKALLKANGLSLSSTIYAGRTLTIPSATVAPSAPTPATKPAPAPAPPAAGVDSTGHYTIKTGDTITSIAKRFGVSVQAIMDANNLTASSLIYAGKTLLIPGLAPASVGGEVTPLSPTMRANAKTIVSVGKQLGVPDYGIVIALAAAAQESGLVNLGGGDHDSIGLFQQRPSMGWGSKAQLLDTTYASRLFFGGSSNPNKGKTSGLLDVKGWQSMPLTKAAQAVQISAYPNAYAKWEVSARAWLAGLK